jgi:SNF2 family DNA or RNA helicase
MSLSIIVDIKDDEHFIATFSEFDNKLVDVLKTLPNRAFQKGVNGWVFPIIDLFILKKIAKVENIPVLVTEKANEKYLEFAEKMKAIKDVADQKTTDYEILGLKKDVVLRNFQKVGIEYLDTIQDGLMAYDMGLGKTPIGISVVSNAIKKYDAKKTLVIVPASMKDQWGYQIAKFSNYSYTIVDGKDRSALYRKNTNFIIVNYDLVWRDIEDIKDLEWDLVICDEIQRARNYKTDTFKALNQLKAKRKIGLTGTPIENDLMDLFTIMKFLNPKIYGKSSHSFIQRYCTLNYFGQIDHSRYKNLEEINKKIGFSMIRRKKRDVLDELPEKTINHFYVNLSALEMKHYKEIKNGILEDIKTGKIKNVTALSQVIYLRELCDCLNLVIEKDKIVSSKLDELKLIIKDLPPDAKIVIFTQFERMAKILEDNIGLKSVHLHGGVKQGCKWANETEKDILKKNKELDQKELDIMVHESKVALKCIDCPYYSDDSKCKTRKKIMAQFENEKDIRAFISTNAGSSGIDLQSASVIINYDLSFNPAVNEQRIARIDRMGQKASKILVINMVVSNTIEEKVLKILEKKQKLFDQVIDNVDEVENMKLIFNTENIKDLL